MADWFIGHPSRLAALLMGAAVVALILGYWVCWKLTAPAFRTRAHGPGRESADGAARPESVSHQAIVAALHSLEGFHDRQSKLAARLTSQARQWEKRRRATLAAVELLRQSAQTIRLPQTLSELYASLISLPSKGPEARQADFDWHATAGVSPNAMHRWVGDRRAGCVEFGVGDQAFVLDKITFDTPVLNFEEFTLFNAHHDLLARVRIRLGPHGSPSSESVVTACRPGGWIGTLADLRLRMDERRESVLLKTRYRDLERLRQDFGVQGDDAVQDHRR